MSQAAFLEEEIGGHTFQVYMLPPLVAMEMFTDLATMAGPAISVVAQVNEGVGTDLIAKALEVFFKNYTSSKGQDIIKKLAAKTMVDGRDLGKKENFDTLFLGKIGLMFKWIIFALKCQFSDFLADWGGVLEDQSSLLGQIRQVSQSLDT